MDHANPERRQTTPNSGTSQSRSSGNNPCASALSTTQSNTMATALTITHIVIPGGLPPVWYQDG